MISKDSKNKPMQELFSEFTLDEMIPAVVSAIMLYAELTEAFEADEKSAQEDVPQSPDNLEKLEETTETLLNLIFSVFLGYHELGNVSDFLNLVLANLEKGSSLSSSISFAPIVLRALSEGSLIRASNIELLRTLEEMEKNIRMMIQDTLEVNAKRMTKEEAVKRLIESKEILWTNVYVATVGRNNVGKGVITGYLRKKYGFQANPLSDRVREMAVALGHPPPHDRATLIEVGKLVKNLSDPAVLMRSAITLFSSPDSQNLLLFDGLRVEGEALGLQALSSDNTEVACIAIVTGEEDSELDLRERFIRALGRGGDKDPKEDNEEEFAKFKELDAAESTGIDAAMEHADYTVSNKTGEIEETFRQVDKIMNQLGVKPIKERVVERVKEVLPDSKRIQCIGTISGSTELFDSPDISEFDNVYALVLEVDGNPSVMQMLNSTREDIADAIEKMVQEVNPDVVIMRQDKLSDLSLIVEDVSAKL